MKNAIAYLMMLVALLSFSGCGGDTTNDTNTTEASVSITVKSQDGALLNQANVSIDETSGLSNEEGLVTLGTSLSEEAVVHVSLAGFVNQSVVTAVTEETNLQVVMIPVKETLNITNIEQAQVIKGSDLNAQITLPANALVDANGNVAEGNVTLNLTPWDITNSDLAAMLGNGQALTAQNERVELISAGMMSVSFYDAQGNYLQLAENTTAQIQMDLPYDSINNVPLAEGDTIPLWHFDEVSGLWLEEGTGTVVYSATSPANLAVQADVPHFSTWNWDFKMVNGGSATVRCQNFDGSATSCNVLANITLDDGSHLTRSHTVPLEGYTIINMPTSGTIQWNASKDGLIGTKISGISGDIVITLKEPTTNNFVQCKINGKGTACTTTMQTQDGQSREFSIPAEGATIATSLEGVSSFTWEARSFDLIENSTVVYYTGGTTSNTTQAVIINLDQRFEVGAIANTISVACINSQYTKAVTCNIRVDDQREGSFYKEFPDVLVGEHRVVTLPNDLGENSTIHIYVDGKDTNGDYIAEGSKTFDYTNLKDAQVIDVTLTPYG